MTVSVRLQPETPVVISVCVPSRGLEGGMGGLGAADKHHGLVVAEDDWECFGMIYELASVLFL